jgi:putative ABC transport system permease protein
MRTLNRQLLRELREHRGQVVSIALVVAAGVLSVITMRAMYRSLDVARDSYYRDYRFGHVFARLERAPETLARRVAAIPGVATVDRRIVRQVVVDVPGLDQPATGQIVSVPADPETMLNRVHLRAGRWTRQGSDDEAIVSERFVTANGLGLGDSVGMVLNGRYRTIRIAGIGISPEFVYEVSPSGAFFNGILDKIMNRARTPAAGEEGEPATALVEAGPALDEELPEAEGGVDVAADVEREG